VTPFKTNLKKQKARFLTKQILRDGVEGTKVNKKQYKIK
jgi:hypothetical protein